MALTAAEYRTRTIRKALAAAPFPLTTRELFGATGIDPTVIAGVLEALAADGEARTIPGPNGRVCWTAR